LRFDVPPNGALGRNAGSPVIIEGPKQILLGDGKMAEWRCKKCGDTAYSKCVTQRTTFPEDQVATLISNTFSDEIQERERDHLVTLKFSVYKMPDDTREAILMRIMKMFQQDDEVLKHAICNHEWEITEGECMFGCHKAKEKEDATL